MSQVVLAANSVGKSYRAYSNELSRVLGWVTGHPRGFTERWALRNVTFELRRSEAIGVVGRNGAGKSTLLKMIAGTTAPTEGSVRVAGRVNAILELGVGFNLDFAARENILHSCSLMGFHHDEIAQALPEIAAFADIGPYFSEPMRIYSTGMLLRVAFATATAFLPDVLIIDEALAVGDVFFRQKCYSRIAQLRGRGTALLLVSHSMADIEQHCDRAILLDAGSLIDQGKPSEVVKHYYLLHQLEEVPGVAEVGHSTGTLTQDVPEFPVHAALPIDDLPQFNAFGARCTRVAVTDIEGKAQRSFRFGETIVFHHEYNCGGYSGFPIGGVVISDRSRR